MYNSISHWLASLSCAILGFQNHCDFGCYIAEAGFMHAKNPIALTLLGTNVKLQSVS